jgi:hypothetical protein
MLRSELELLRSTPDYYILHEHLEALNEPVYFHEFIERAHRHGLQYLADADLAAMPASRFAPQVTDLVRRLAPDPIRQQQLMDFLGNRTFRQTLLMRADQPIDRQVTVQRVEELWVSSSAAPASRKPNLAEGVVEKFCTAAGVCMSTSKAITKSALLTLSACWPVAVAEPELMTSAYSRLNPLAAKPPRGEDFATLAADLLQSYTAGIVELHIRASPFSIEPGTRPRVNRFGTLSGRTRGAHPRCATRSVIPDAIRALLPVGREPHSDDIPRQQRHRGPAC